ncbi:cation:proton antiporter [Halopelagius fulvigenes]|uniref:Cation:proton antiporter n=1 Tax=Halopelagius fulvigenes TaxID=1198324 RepID=A0ABD5TYA4_9EURY
MASYYVALIVVSLAILGAAVLPRVFADKPISLPIIYLASGAVLFFVAGVDVPHPVARPEVTERLTELVVIIALMGAGLKLDRPFDWGAWSSTWRLLAITMPLSIAGTALLGWWVLGAHVATAILMGAVIAPTDPVLAADVQTGPPAEGTDEEIDPEEQEGTIRFALTSEAGLNDGLAFPFTNLAIALAGAASLAAGEWLRDWVLVDVLYKIIVGVIAGYVVGRLIARFVFGEPASTRLAVVMEGSEALAATLFAYGATELVHGYGFIAVFVTALVLRHYEWEHGYYEHLHDFAVMTERLLMAGILVLFGGTLVNGLLDPLTLPMVGVGLLILFVVRPVAGMVGLLGHSAHWAERLVIATFGIRGIGSFYYLAHALNEATFKEQELIVAAEELWALLGFIVATSTVVHGIAASPVMEWLDERRA